MRLGDWQRSPPVGATPQWRDGTAARGSDRQSTRPWSHPRVSKVDLKVAALEFAATDGPEPAEQRLRRAKAELIADGLVVDIDEAREAQYVHYAMPMRWGRFSVIGVTSGRSRP